MPRATQREEIKVNHWKDPQAKRIELREGIIGDEIGMKHGQPFKNHA